MNDIIEDVVMNKFNYFLIMGLFLFVACKENKVAPVENDGTPPKPVTNVQVENMHGKARIQYDLPDDSDLLYVKAEYQLNSGGEVRETKASYFKDYLMVEGFDDTTKTQVTLYAVDRSENVSEPVSVDIEPLTPPILDVFQSLQVVKDFGGINVTFENKNEAEIVISTIIVDSLGEWISANNFYTKRSEGDFSVRGYDAEQREFGLFIRDRWNNHSDTLYKEVTPLFEELLDKTQFQEIEFPNSPEPYSGSYVLSNIWDDDIGTMYHSTQQQSQGAGFPLWFTFDLGARTKLSRFRVWPRQGDWIYGHGNFKMMEVWGSNNPATDGSFDGWEKLMIIESFKPSGLPTGQYSNEDAEYAAAGEEFVFPAEAPEVRYIRFKVIESWGSGPGSPSGFVHIAEVSFWGQNQ